jgi:hypothetical protein
VTTPSPTGPGLLAAWQGSGLGHKEFWREFYQEQMTYGQFSGKIWRAKQGLLDRSHLYSNPLEESWNVSGDFVIIGDVQIPTTDYDFAALPMAIAKKHLKRPRRAIFAGDLMNVDAFSGYESDIPTPSFEREVEATQAFFEEYLSIFDEIYWFMGNHERRLGKKTHGAISHKHLRNMTTKERARVHVNSRGYMTVNTVHGLWRVTHSKAYSIQQLNVADTLAQKYQMHIISHHEHHLAKGWDRYKRYVIINNGGLFLPEEMGYAVMDDGKNANMTNGFTLLKNGIAEVYGQEPYTDWEKCLG